MNKSPRENTLLAQHICGKQAREVTGLLMKPFISPPSERTFSFPKTRSEEKAISLYTLTCAFAYTHEAPLVSSPSALNPCYLHQKLEV